MTEPLTTKELAKLLDELGTSFEYIRATSALWQSEKERGDTGATWNNKWMVAKMERLQEIKDRLFDLLDQEALKPVTKGQRLRDRTLEEEDE